MRTTKGLLFLFLLLFVAKAVYAQNNEWTWMKGVTTINNNGVYGTQGTVSSVNNPRARYLSTSWTDAAGNLWLFGGSGYNTSTNQEESLNDLWRYNPATNNWVWLKGDKTPNKYGVYGTQGTAATANQPGARRLGVNWKDKAGNQWLYGGFGLAAASYGYLSDLWKYDPASNQWTFIKGDTITNVLRIHGTYGVASPNNNPGGRYGSVSWTDTSGNFWLFGGTSTQAATVFFNDLWKYNTATNQWTWVKGDSTLSPPNVYGTKGIATALTRPSGRAYSTGYTDAAGSLWLYGGIENRNGNFVLVNDLWKYNAAANQWTWIKGDSSANNYGDYGLQGIASPSGRPGSRENAFKWADPSGKFWLYGGYGYAESNSQGYLNDLWNYNPTTNDWAWAKGEKVTNLAGIYGTQGTPGALNNPGSRHAGVSWTDSAGSLWLFGGWGYGTTTTNAGNLNDVWKYKPGIILPVHLISFTAQLQRSSSPLVGNPDYFGVMGGPATTRLLEGEVVLLNWKVATEQNLERYQIERSPGGKDFTPIGTIKAANTKKYTYTDKNPKSNDSMRNEKTATVFYRLKMIDKDGSFSYSNIARVKLRHSSSTLHISPNPAHGMVTITGDHLISIALTDNAGKIVLLKTAVREQNTQLYVGHLSKGIYLIKATSSDGYVQNEKLVVQ